MFPNGKIKHMRTVISYKRYDAEIKRVFLEKYKYAYAFDKNMRKYLKSIALPYPKRMSSNLQEAFSPEGNGGSNPTHPLHSMKLLHKI